MRAWPSHRPLDGKPHTAGRKLSLNALSAKQSPSEHLPEVGDLVRIRSRRWLVEEVVRPDKSGQSPIVRLSARAAALELNKRQIETPAGGRWHAQTVSRVRARLQGAA